jgi:hypothetical protein
MSVAEAGSTVIEIASPSLPRIITVVAVEEALLVVALIVTILVAEFPCAVVGLSALPERIRDASGAISAVVVASVVVALHVAHAILGFRIAVVLPAFLPVLIFEFVVLVEVDVRLAVATDKTASTAAFEVGHLVDAHPFVGADTAI